MPTLDQHIDARNDHDLLARVIAAAEITGIDNAQGWAEAHMGQIVAATINGDTTIADVHAFAVANYDPPPRPGEDPASVTDAQIIEAVTAARAD